VPGFSCRDGFRAWLGHKLEVCHRSTNFAVTIHHKGKANPIIK